MPSDVTIAMPDIHTAVDRNPAQNTECSSKLNAHRYTCFGQVLINHLPGLSYPKTKAEYTKHFNDAQVSNQPELFPCGSGSYPPFGNAPVSICNATGQFQSVASQHTGYYASGPVGNTPAVLHTASIPFAYQNPPTVTLPHFDLTNYFGNNNTHQARDNRCLPRHEFTKFNDDLVELKTFLNKIENHIVRKVRDCKILLCCLYNIAHQTFKKSSSTFPVKATTDLN